MHCVAFPDTQGKYIMLCFPLPTANNFATLVSNCSFYVAFNERPGFTVVGVTSFRLFFFI